MSYPSGAFTYDIELLKIGQGDFPRSLSYGLQYNSGSARAPNQAWTHNLTLRMSKTLVDDPASTIDAGRPHPEWQTWLHNVVMGQRSAGFEKYNANPATADPFVPVTRNGETLTFTRTDPQGNYNGVHGFYTYTGRNGEVITFRNVDLAISPGRGATWVEPDGTTLTYQYAGGTSSVASNRGYAIFLTAPQTISGSSLRTICALDLTQHHLGSLTACPAGVPTATVDASSATDAGFGRITSIVKPDGNTYNYGYSYSNAGGRARQHLNCVTNPGQASCAVANVYDSCDGPNGPFQESIDLNWTGSRDRVISQTLATGETLTYSYPPQTGNCRGNASVTMTDAASASTVIVLGRPEGVIEQVTDPLARRSSFTYTGGSGGTFTEGGTTIATMTSPEADQTAFAYDDRGNKTETRRKAKPGSGLPDLITSAVYPGPCDNPKTCNKPMSTTDARGAVTDYAYDPVHGGVLTETGPAVGGVRPQKRYAYAQRRAWLKDATGGFSPASPVWVMTQESFCKSGAASGNGCATASEEVVTTYDYGPDSGPNNLLLRGIVVDAGPGRLNLRTCYAYDASGNKIGETSPRAGLSSCPSS